MNSSESSRKPADDPYLNLAEHNRSMKDKRRIDGSPACNRAGRGASESFEEIALQVLRTTGLRVTMPRVQVIRTLGESNRALSAYAIHERIHAGGGMIDVVSVYRILAMLQSAGLVHHIGIVDGYIPCRLQGDHDTECEHMVCAKCGCVTELPLSSVARDATTAQAKSVGFDPSSIKVELLGTCKHCAAG
jgi:Fe2+ or Zn2+ uptake regulation protein